MVTLKGIWIGNIKVLANLTNLFDRSQKRVPISGTKFGMISHDVGSGRHVEKGVSFLQVASEHGKKLNTKDVDGDHPEISPKEKFGTPEMSKEVEVHNYAEESPFQRRPLS